jgi:hypothetical protein
MSLVYLQLACHAAGRGGVTGKGGYRIRTALVKGVARIISDNTDARPGA